MSKASTRVFVGILTALGAIVAATGCGDDEGGSGGGSSETTTTSSAGGGGGQGGQAGGPTCEGYCDAITTNCAGARAQYYNKDVCLAVCAHFSGDGATGNTLGCHADHADAAATDPDAHCTQAGPSGAGACGDAAANFCELAADICPDVYGDEAACAAAAAGFDADVPYSSAAPTTGDTLVCRLYHLTAAAADPATHCAHIGVDSPVCK